MIGVIFAYVGGSLIILSLALQLMKIIRLKSSKDVAIETFCVLTVAQIACIIYGSLFMLLEIIIINSICCVLSSSIISSILYFRYKERKSDIQIELV